MSKNAFKPIVVVVVLGVLGFILLNFNKNDDNQQQADQTAPSGLSEREKKELEDEIVELQSKLATTDDLERKFDIYEDIAGLNEKLNRLDAAKSAYREAIKLRPDNAGIHTDLFDLLVKQGLYAEAEGEIQTAISLNGNSTRWKKYIALYKDNLKSGNEKVDALYNEAMTKEPKDVEIVKAYARFLEEIGDNAKAVTMWQKASVLDPEQKADHDAEIQRINLK
jgi:cytochrome c-type biogenesis protein CcmH/NrfG